MINLLFYLLRHIQLTDGSRVPLHGPALPPGVTEGARVQG